MILFFPACCHAVQFAYREDERIGRASPATPEISRIYGSLTRDTVLSRFWGVDGLVCWIPKRAATFVPRGNSRFSRSQAFQRLQEELPTL